MPYHKLPATLFGGAAVGLAYVLYGLISQPRTIAWYAAASGLLFAEYVFSGLFYRLVFHPLAKYPGPLTGCLTDFYTAFWIVHGARHLDLHKQHKKYGKYVRYGPNRLSINSVAASRDLHDVKSNAVKSDAYGAAKIFFGSEMSMTMTDVKEHAFRRRVNMTAMTPSAVKEFSPLVTPHVDYLMGLLGNGAGSAADGDKGWSAPRDMAIYFAHCIGDIMGTVTFSRSWETQKEETYRRFVEGSPDGVAGIHLVGHLQSLFRFNMHKILFKELIVGVGELMAASTSFATWRMQQTDMKNRDIWAALLDARDPNTGHAFTEEQLISEAGLFIVGGTDGLITAVSSTLFYLLHNDKVMQRVMGEIRDAYPIRPEDVGKPASKVTCPIEFSSQELQKITYLLACIDESLRLSPPVASILPRQIGSGGQILDGEFFPEGISVGIPHYSLQRTEEYFPEAHKFIPERWLPEERAKGNAPVSGLETVNQKAGNGQGPAFTPFGAGRASCIGKYLAYQEMSYVLARLLWQYDMRIEPGNTTGEGSGDDVEGRGCRGEYQLNDRFVSKQNGPVVQYRYRQELRA